MCIHQIVYGMKEYEHIHLDSCISKFISYGHIHDFTKYYILCRLLYEHIHDFLYANFTYMSQG
jgi:hypothetical protein